MNGSFSNSTLGMYPGRLGALIGRSSGYLESLHPSVKRRIIALKNLQNLHYEVEARFHDEVLALEKKYAKLYLPFYQKRKQFISGAIEPTDEECKVLDPTGDIFSDISPISPVKGDALTNIGVSDFWLVCFKNHPELSELITEDDEEALAHLVDVRFTYLEDTVGFRLEFEFEDNDFFEDKVLTKTYYLHRSNEYRDFVYDGTVGCDIKWKKGKNLTTRTVESQVASGRGRDHLRVIKSVIPGASFFNFFSPPELPGDDKDLGEDEAAELESILQADYQLGDDFKEKLIPNAIHWFTGEALQYEETESDDMDAIEINGDEESDSEEEDED